MEAFVSLANGLAVAIQPMNLLFAKLLTLSLPAGPIERLF